MHSKCFAPLRHAPLSTQPLAAHVSVDLMLRFYTPNALNVLCLSLIWQLYRHLHTHTDTSNHTHRETYKRLQKYWNIFAFVSHGFLFAFMDCFTSLFVHKPADKGGDRREKGKIRPNSQSATCTHNCQICISINSLSVCMCSNNNNDNKKLSRYLSFSQWHLFSCSLPAFYIFCHTLWLACKQKGMIGSTVVVEGEGVERSGVKYANYWLFLQCERCSLINYNFHIKFIKCNNFSKFFFSNLQLLLQL